MKDVKDNRRNGGTCIVDKTTVKKLLEDYAKLVVNNMIVFQNMERLYIQNNLKNQAKYGIIKVAFKR